MTLFSLKFRPLLTMLVLGVLLLVGCSSSNSPEPEAAASPTQAQSDEDATDTQPDGYPAPGSADQPDGYPAPGSADQPDGYPAPTTPPLAEARARELLPTPTSNDVGTIAGTISLASSEGVVPLQYGQLYIAEVLYDDNGERSAAAYTNEAPTVTTDDAGHFAFTDLPPGEYALFYWTPASSILLPDNATGDTLIINLEGGQIVDLGLLTYDF